MFQVLGKRPRIAYEIVEDQVTAGLVAHGFGIAIVPEMELLSSLNVKVIEILHPVVKRNIYMVSSDQFYMPPVVRNFHDFVLEAVSQNL
jgi:DNA-binding transcriptional LysR family regulator